jgi:hypothetical protein
MWESVSSISKVCGKGGKQHYRFLGIPQTVISTACFARRERSAGDRHRCTRPVLLEPLPGAVLWIDTDWCMSLSTATTVQQTESARKPFSEIPDSAIQETEPIKKTTQETPEEPEGCALARDIRCLWNKSQKDGAAALLQEQTGQNSMRALICMLRPPTVVALIAPAPCGRSGVDRFTGSLKLPSGASKLG